MHRPQLSLRELFVMMAFVGSRGDAKCDRNAHYPNQPAHEAPRC